MQFSKHQLHAFTELSLSYRTLNIQWRTPLPSSRSAATQHHAATITDQYRLLRDGSKFYITSDVDLRLSRVHRYSYCQYQSTYIRVANRFRAVYHIDINGQIPSVRTTYVLSGDKYITHTHIHNERADASWETIRTILQYTQEKTAEGV